MAENEVVIDKYKLMNCLSQGRHSQVWEATELTGSRAVALKVLLAEAYKDKEHRQTLKFEAKVAKSLDHPNIIRIIECIVSRTHAYIAMELFRAPNAKIQLVNERNAILLRARKLIESTADALSHMHGRGWIHKDVKPENILINKSSEVRLIDFSLAGKPASSLGQMVNRKKKGFVQGTRTYMSPEQIRNQPLTPLTDLYSLGITAFEVLTGRPPFRSPHPDDLLMDHLKTAPPPPSFFNPNITPEMDQIVLKMLAKSPKNRQSGIDEFLAEFRNVQIFKESIREESELTEQEKHEVMLKNQDEGLESRVDSRLDAMRTAARKNNPNAVQAPLQTKSKVALKVAPEVKTPAPAVPPPQQPSPQQPPPPQQPQHLGQPGMPMQALTPEQMALHQQMLQQQQAYYQQALYQQAMQHQMPPQPGMPQPQMPQPPVQPPADQLPQPPQPPAAQPPAAQPPAAQPPPAATPPKAPQPATPPPAKKAEEKPPSQPTDGTLMHVDDMEDMFKSLPDV